MTRNDELLLAYGEHLERTGAAQADYDRRLANQRQRYDKHAAERPTETDDEQLLDLPDLLP